MNELEKRANIHRRKRRGLSPFCKLDAGNVELNNTIFNGASPEGGPNVNPNGPMAGEMSSGGDGACCESLTEGISRAEIISQLKARGKNYKWDRFPDEQLYSIWKRIIDQEEAEKANHIPEEEPEDFEPIEHETCDKCGRRLTDVTKECPYCDLGDESVLEEDYNDQEIVELEYEDLPIEYDYGTRSWEDGSYSKHMERTVSHTYKITKDEALEVFQDDLWATPECENMSDDEFGKYLEDNADELIEKHMDEIKAYYLEYAMAEAQEENDPYEIEANEEADYWDSQYDDRYDFDESINPYDKDADVDYDDDCDLFLRGV